MLEKNEYIGWNTFFYLKKSTNNKLNVISITKILFIGGLLFWILMGNQSYLPCCQASSAPSSDYRMTVKSTSI